MSVKWVGRVLREEIAHTVTTETEVTDELQPLRRILSS